MKFLSAALKLKENKLLAFNYNFCRFLRRLHFDLHHYLILFKCRNQSSPFIVFCTILE